MVSLPIQLTASTLRKVIQRLHYPLETSWAQLLILCLVLP
jgi:hypothetical protein